LQKKLKKKLTIKGLKMDEGIKFGIIFLIGAMAIIGGGFYHVIKKLPKE